MGKTFEEYTQRMGYMPSYQLPEKLEEDDEFEYFKFKVPRQYIKEHIEMGDVWPHDVDTDIVGTEDASIVLGVMFLPVYSGVEYLEEDEDFLYYKIRVPIVFLDYPIRGSKFTYRLVYEKLNFESPEQRAERESVDIECKKAPKAGEPMPDKEVLSAVRKVKESKPLLYEIVFKCQDGDCGRTYTEVGSDLFDLLYSRSCSACASTRLELVKCNTILEEDEDG
ncbi:MAG: hypothetical protein ACXADW_23005 [Candidatus Hodarchaeales archaeon]|jgi:hypothetical protein